MVRRGRLAQLVARFVHTEEVVSSSLASPTAASGSAGTKKAPARQERGPASLRCVATEQYRYRATATAAGDSSASSRR